MTPPARDVATRARLRLARLRRAVLAMAVLEDVDLTPRDDGVDLAAGGRLTWADVAVAAGPWADHPDHPVTRLRLRVAAHVVGVLAVGGPEPLLATCHAHAQPLAGAAMAGGPGWVREHVGGGTLGVGLGVSGLADLEGPYPLPPLPSLRDPEHGALAARLDLRWTEARSDLERLGGLAEARLRRDGAEGRPLVLRPTGTADVPTLLASRRLRGWLAAGDGTGMRAVAVPVRDRGWFDLARIDPAYVRAAWAASEPLDRALDRPLLVTADDVAAPVASGDVLAGVLADPAGRGPRSLRHT